MDAPRIPGSLQVGVAATTAAVLILQIALTRLFSFTIWYHFAYVTVSVALLGYGAAGSFLAAFAALEGARPGARLGAYSRIASVASLGAMVAVAKIPLRPFDLWKEPFVQSALLVAMCLAITLPFFFAGLTIAIALKANASVVSRLYFVDLLGAGLGGAAAVPAIWLLGTPGSAAVAALLLAIAGLAFAWREGGRGAGVAWVAVVALASVGLARGLAFPPSPEKFLGLFSKDPGAIELAGPYWTPIYRTDVFWFKDADATRGLSYAGWGVSPVYAERAKREAPHIRFIAHDGDACAVIYAFDGDLGKLALFDHHVLGAPYVVKRTPRVLVVGVGGGTDIVNAVAHRATSVTGVELDPVTVRIVGEDLRDFTGDLYGRPEVNIVAGEGRSFVRHAGERWDLIQLSGVDTMAALTTGAYVLAESYLYTVEAVSEFLDHLDDDGMLSLLVGDVADGHGYPRHTVRQLSLFTEALARRGIQDPSRHVVVIASTESVPQVACMLKKSPFTPEEVAALEAFASRLGFHVWASPSRSRDSSPAKFLGLDPGERRAFLANEPLRLTPITDDSPFFFSFYRWRDLPGRLHEIDLGHTLATGQIVLAVLLVIVAGLAALLVLLPLVVFRRRGLAVPGRWPLTAYFTGIGLGFIMLEICLVQRCVLFLGYPTYALSVVLLSLLLSSGIGSFAAPRIARTPADRIGRLLAGVLVVGGGQLLLLPLLFASLLGLPLPARIAIVVAAVAPLGLVLGAFFPTGIEVVGSIGPSFVPWAWGVNGAASVVGTVLAVIVAMTWGFRTTGAIALVVYAVASLALWRVARASDRDRATSGAGRLA